MSKKKLGIVVIVAPFIGLFLTLALWMLVVILTRGGDGSLALLRVANVALGLLGLISVLGIPVGLVVGVILMASSNKPAAETKPEALAQPSAESQSNEPQP